MQIFLRFSCLWLLCETISSDRGSDRSSDINILDMVAQQSVAEGLVLSNLLYVITVRAQPTDFLHLLFLLFGTCGRNFTRSMLQFGKNTQYV